MTMMGQPFYERLIRKYLDDSGERCEGYEEKRSVSRIGSAIGAAFLKTSD